MSLKCSRPSATQALQPLLRVIVIIPAAGRVDVSDDARVVGDESASCCCHAEADESDRDSDSSLKNPLFPLFWSCSKDSLAAVSAGAG
jgi:hypothetical protein